jgi:hypothetical protein
MLKHHINKCSQSFYLHPHAILSAEQYVFDVLISHFVLYICNIYL